MGDSAYRGYRGALNVGSGGTVPYSETADLAQESRAKDRGFFQPQKLGRFRDTLDGLANTIAAGEIATDLGDKDIRTIAYDGSRDPIRDNPSWCLDSGQIDPNRPQFWLSAHDFDNEIYDVTEGRGFRWADFLPNYSGFYTILPPNSETCGHSNTSETMGSVSSRHSGGAHVLMADGAVKFITDSIEAGNRRARMVDQNGTGISAAGQKSPYGLWGALGTRASKEVIDEEL